LFRIAGYASFGYAGPFDFAHTAKFGYCVGAVLSWGDKHRVLLDASFGAVRFSSERYIDGIHDIERARVFHGPALQLGYEYMTYGGFFLRVELGASFLVDPGDADLDSNLIRAGTLGLGFKLW
jgi:hypothetical protein